VTNLVSSADMWGIDRTSPLPFYHQLKQLILADIKDRGLAPGDRLRGDHELSARYDVSRTVVRQALSELETEGVLERVKGRGTYLAPRRTSERLVQSLTGLYEDVEARGSHLRSEVRRLEVVPADEQVASALRIAVGASVVVIERLRFVDDEPWALVIGQLPVDVAPGLPEEDLTHQSLYALLEQKYGVALRHGRRSVQASVASAEVAASLGIAEGDAVLVLRSTVYGDDERPVEMFVAYHRGDRSRFEVDLTRHADGSELQPLMRITV
jgi:GntR family transcriptional regulator